METYRGGEKCQVVIGVKGRNLSHFIILFKLDIIKMIYKSEN